MEMNLPNKLTLLRVCLIPVFLIALITDIFSDPLGQYLATSIFIIASLTDALDGHIARSRNLVTNFGKFMDPLADKLLVASALISLLALGLLPTWVVIVIISREFIITGFRLLAVEQNIIIAAGSTGKLKTLVTMVMIVFVMLDLPWQVMEVINPILIYSSVFLTILSAVEYIYKNFNVLNNGGK